MLKFWTWTQTRNPSNAIPLFNRFAWTNGIVNKAVGLQFTLGANQLGYTEAGNPIHFTNKGLPVHYTIDDDPLHYTLREED